MTQGPIAGQSVDTSVQMLTALTPEARTMVISTIPPEQRVGATLLLPVDESLGLATLLPIYVFALYIIPLRDQ